MQGRLGKLGMAAIVMASLTTGAEAAAIQITPADVSNMFGFTASGFSTPDSTPVSASFSALIQSYAFNAGFNRTELGLNVTLTNTTAASHDSSLRGYGFNSTPDVTGGLSNSTIFDTMTSGGNGVVETCVADTVHNKCTGLSGNGLGSGQQSTHLLTLFFAGDHSSVTLGALDGDDHNQALTGFFFRFMSVEGADGEGGNEAKIWGSPSGFGGSDRDAPIPTPEPGTLVLLGSALGLAARKLRRRSTAA